jgi:hypothetical protein
MKKALALATSILMACLTAPAIAQSKIPSNLNQDPEKFCFVAGVISAGIMERLNVGYRQEYVYDEVNRLDQPQLRAYLNETVALAAQFAQHSSGPVEPKLFAEWNYQRCLIAMKPRRHEVIHADGSKTYLDN